MSAQQCPWGWRETLARCTAIAGLVSETEKLEHLAADRATASAMLYELLMNLEADCDARQAREGVQA